MRKMSLVMLMLFVVAAVGFTLFLPASADPVATTKAAAPSKPVPPALPALDKVPAAKAKDSLTRALAYLTKTQGKDGEWFPQAGPGVTAMIIRGFLGHPDYNARSPVVAKALAYVLKFVKPDGGIYGKGHKNYNTAICVMALFDADKVKYLRQIKDAQRYLKQLQWDEGEGIEDSDTRYGGAGYGKQRRPDMSNTMLMLEALHETGVSADDPAFKKALKFISRSQNLGETNDQEWAAVVNDGGFIYTPWKKDKEKSKAGAIVYPDGRKGWRSYGTMTYAGFKSYVYAKLAKDDKRVAGAFNWIRANYDLNNNPNMGKQGLYYYYYVFAKGFRAYGVSKIKDVRGIEHDWREDLINKLSELQAKDGSWVNAADRWHEGHPALVTAYCVLALEETLK